ncbi:MAG: hypothetical protein ACXWV8_06085 [Chitinophagaceae bacterium]
MTSKRIAILYCTFIVFCYSQFSCKKDSNNVPRSQLEILTTTEWKVKNLYLRDLDEPVSANTEARAFTFKNCEVDDVYLFKSDSVFVRKDSLIACDPSLLDPFHIGVFGPYNSGRWSADAGFTQMNVANPPFYNYTWKILTLREGLFEIEQNFTDIFGQRYIYTYRFAPLK